MFRFIHCADLHLGRAFAAWRKERPEAARELALAPFAAFDRIAELAIREKARFVVLAGDVFDTSSPSLYAETRFRAALEKLDKAGVRVNNCARAWPCGDAVRGSGARGCDEYPSNGISCGGRRRRR